MNKYVIISSSGPIKELGNLTGPIVTPVRLSQETILKIIKSGHKVYEVNPSNHREKILLTFMNATDKHFNTKLPSYGVIVKNIPEEKPKETIPSDNEIEKYIPEETVSKTVVVDVNEDSVDTEEYDETNVSIETTESFTTTNTDDIDDIEEIDNAEELLNEDEEDFDYELEIDDFKSNSKSGI